ncbi:MAG TPA: sodium-independent anion transporter [Phycisphaerales bacterium]|nr:sodium-independent anion transporter [Phycisphaerales bacterium]|tara:strand:+ start:1235 stop:2914 length:1680 start_codon:yes stop_codon:yes gene_type:complete
MFKPKLFTALKGYTFATFGADAFAGLTVGVVALPLAMAFAIASGVGPERGLYTAIVAGFLISLLGGSRVQIGGPTGAFIVLVAAIVAEHGYDGLVICTLMAGVMLIIMGFAKMGALIKFIPFPVTTGFTTGIAVVIFSTQIKDFFGLNMEHVPSEFLAKWSAYFHHFQSINPATTGIGILTIVTIVVTRKYFPKIPAMLMGMIVATAIASLLHLDVQTIGSRFGDLPSTLPKPDMSMFDLSRIRDLMSPAFTVAMLAAIESLLSATVADGMTGGRHRSNTELIAQGIANIGSAIFGGIPATGAIARTATNIKAGGKTPVAGIIHALTLMLLLLFLAPLAKLIPLSCLAGILIVVSYNMSELDHFLDIFKAPRSDVVVLLATFLLTVLVDLTVAVQIGLVLAAVLFIKRMTEIANIGSIAHEFDDEQNDGVTNGNALDRTRIPEGVEVYEINGPFFFGSADKFKETLRSISTPQVKVMILRMRYVSVMDATGLHVIREYMHVCRLGHIHLLLSAPHTQPMMVMGRAGLLDELGSDNIYGNIDEALDRARELVGMSTLMNI